jgi:hypothetical protein
MVAIGSKTTGITAGNNLVTVAGLVKTALVAATQTVAGQESCVPATGIMVGGGANPSIHVAYSIRETTTAGPVGTVGDVTSANIHFLGATTVSGGSPVGALVLSPSTSWQTVTLQRGSESIPNSANAAGTVADGPGYNPDDSVTIQVFAYRTLHGDTIYSATEAQSSPVTSNDVFVANWTWDTVAGAQGYRLLRDLNAGGYNDYVDVPANSYSDANSGWTAGNTVTPKTTQTDPSVQWNPTVSNTNNLPGQWGVLDSINFAINNLDDTGPFDLYIDNLQNGATVFQTFEGAVAGTTDYGFHAPSYSGSTSGSLLTAPDVGIVSNGAADTGTKSFRVRFQWSGTNATKWLRLTTSSLSGNPMGNPVVNLDDPISIRVLLLPVNAIPVPPPPPTLSISQSAGNGVLNWTGAHNLQAAPKVSGTYTNIPGVITGPYTDAGTPTSGQRFFRLVN